MDNSAMTILVIPGKGMGLVGQGAKGGLEVQEAQGAQDVVGEGNEIDRKLIAGAGYR
jgi:hypothetical protein